MGYPSVPSARALRATLAALALGALAVSPALAADPVLDANNQAAADSGRNAGAPVAQTFRAINSGNVVLVRLMCDRQGEGGADLTVDLVAVDGESQLPTDTVLGTGTSTDEDDACTTRDAWASYVFSTPVPILSGERYAIVWGSEDRWNLTSGNAYADGTAAEVWDPQVGWTETTDADYNFEVYLAADGGGESTPDPGTLPPTDASVMRSAGQTGANTLPALLALVGVMGAVAVSGRFARRASRGSRRS